MEQSRIRIVGYTEVIQKRGSGKFGPTTPILDRLLAILTNGAAFMGRRYVFVAVQFSASKCAIELYEKPEKGEKMACLSVLWKSDHLFSSQWIWGDRQFF